jgi:TonB family protein
MKFMKTYGLRAAMAACCAMGCLAMTADAMSKSLEELSSSELRAVRVGASDNAGATYLLRPANAGTAQEQHLKDAVPEAEARVLHSERIGAIHLNGTDKPLRILHSAFPVYPISARKSGIEGVVEIEMTINENGIIENARVLKSPDALLSDVCLAAVSQWRFQPVTRNGEPVAVKVIQWFPFKLR